MQINYGLHISDPICGLVVFYFLWALLVGPGFVEVHVDPGSNSDNNLLNISFFDLDSLFILLYFSYT